jgi:hypothetical protein
MEFDGDLGHQRPSSRRPTCPGDGVEGSAIEFRHAPVHLDRPSGLGVLVDVGVEAVEQRLQLSAPNTDANSGTLDTP